MHVHKILQITDAEKLAKAPQASHAIKNDLYVLLEPIDGPKDRLHTKRHGPYMTLPNNKTIIGYKISFLNEGSQQTSLD